MNLSLITPEEILPELYGEAKEKGKIKDIKLFGHTFKYASVSINDEYSSLPEAVIDDANEYWELGRHYLGMNFVFVDKLPKEMHDQIGLHEHFEGRKIENYLKSHYLACRDELRLLKEEPKNYETMANFWVKLNRNYGIERFEDEGLFYYFGNLIPNLDDILTEEKLNPVQILNLYQDKLEFNYRNVTVACDCPKILE